MVFNIMTLFPTLYKEFLNTSIIGRAVKNDILKFNLYNIRDYSIDKNKRVDDYVYGGGDGMLISADPIYRCYKDIIKNGNTKMIYMSPRGKLLNSNMAREFANNDSITVLCGHYEGIDERAIKLTSAEEVSIGDYILTGGELPSMILIDVVVRFVKGVLSNENSANEESFTDNLLEYPQYTRPSIYENLKVPEVLLSGDHKKIAEWRLTESKKITKENRPDLYEKYIKTNGGIYE